MNLTKIECCKCGVPITRRIDGYELCRNCYTKALENQRLLFQELAQWVKDNDLSVVKITLTTEQELPNVTR